MRLSGFTRMIEDLSREIPQEFLEGIVAIDVSRRTVPHPDVHGVYTLGECVPLAFGSSDPQSRLVIYYGSFWALASTQADFDWEAEAWETLSHELRHHLEWKAGRPDLEAYDWAVEQAFARAEGRQFDPSFYLDGERLAPDHYRIEDDLFIDRVVTRLPRECEVEWKNTTYRVAVPSTSLPVFLALDGLAPLPPAEVYLVLRTRPGIRTLFGPVTSPAERRGRVEPV